MDFNRYKGRLKDYAEEHLDRSRRGGRFVCPVCHSGGSGRASSDSAFHITSDGMKWSCFSCNGGGDIFDLAAAVEGLDPNDRAAHYRAVTEWAGEPAGERPARPVRAAEVRPAVEVDPETLSPVTEAVAACREREKGFIVSCRGLITHPEARSYIEGRGYTVEEAKSLGWGFDADRHRLVIPYPGADHYHIDRDVTGSPRGGKYLKPKAGDVGPEPLYNAPALRGAGEVCFVVEGPMDAAAVTLAGHRAVALGGVGARGLLSELEGVPEAERAVLVLMLDRDKAGSGAARSLAAELDERHVAYLEASDPEGAPWPEGAKDPDEARLRDREGLSAYLSAVGASAVAEVRERRAREREEYLRSLCVYRPADVAGDLLMGKGLWRSVPTGMAAVDSKLGGGLLEGGLVILGAISSMGKTSLLLQWADSMAEAGRQVLFVTIEQSAKELVAKSLARYMALIDGREGRGGMWQTARNILDADERGTWGEGRTALMLDAVREYQADTDGRLHLMQGAGRPTVRDVRGAARAIQLETGEAPVVIVDYLQLLQPEDPSMSDKQVTDANVSALRQLARDLQSPVVAISSLNRSSYSGSIKLDSFKESGAIEYGADVLLGLQPRNLASECSTAKGEAEERKAAMRATLEMRGRTEREVELVVLKHRNGAVCDEGIPLTFNAMKGLFF